MKKGKLSKNQVELLEKVPGMHDRMASWIMEAGQAKGFDSRCADLAAWAHREHRLPRRKAKDTVESSLAQLLSQVIRKYRQGWLEAEQVALLLEIPGVDTRIAVMSESSSRQSLDLKIDEFAQLRTRRSKR